MAKKSKKAKKAGQTTLPSTIAGIKIPKDIRKAGAKIAEHPIISDIVAAGLLAAAAALSNEGVRRKTAKAAGDAATDVAKSTSRAKVAVKAAAGAMGKAILDEIKGGKGGGAKA